MERYDAVVVGAGPNGLAAAITIAREGRSVLVLEAADEIGGGARSGSLTLPGFVHDLGSAVHPMAVASPFFRTLSLERFGLEWVYAPAELAHVHGDGSASLLFRSVDETASQLGADEAAYRRLLRPLTDGWDDLAEFLLGPPIAIPRHPFQAARFGLRAIQSGKGLADRAFGGDRAKALFAGLAAHSFLSLDAPLSASFGLVLGAVGHRVGWPIPRGGAGAIAKALTDLLLELGGEVRTGARVERLEALPTAKATLFDLAPAALARIAGEALAPEYRKRLERFRPGPGAFKMDWALSGPIPWRDPRCLQAPTVHLGGDLADMVRSEAAMAAGSVSEKPFVLLAQPSLFDPSRAPEGKHTVWAYLHVPNGSTDDLRDRLEGRIEAAAPGFRDLILARSTMDPAALERYDANLVGGDVGGGANTPAQIFGRPVFSPSPYRTSNPAIFLCSASTPPGGGVHGMCGFHAARAALRGILW